MEPGGRRYPVVEVMWRVGLLGAGALVVGGSTFQVLDALSVSGPALPGWFARSARPWSCTACSACSSRRLWIRVALEALAMPLVIAVGMPGVVRPQGSSGPAPVAPHDEPAMPTAEGADPAPTDADVDGPWTSDGRPQPSH